MKKAKTVSVANDDICILGGMWIIRATSYRGYIVDLLISEELIKGSAVNTYDIISTEFKKNGIQVPRDDIKKAIFEFVYTITEVSLG